MVESMRHISILKFYQSVIQDTVTSCVTLFAEEGISEEVLKDLKNMWETKIINSKAVQRSPLRDFSPTIEPIAGTSSIPKEQIATLHQSTIQSFTVDSNSISSANALNFEQVNTLQQTQIAPKTVIGTDTLNFQKLVPIQIKFPASPGSNSVQISSALIKVPSSLLTGDQLKKIITGPIIDVVKSLPQTQASNLLQQHVDISLQGFSGQYTVLIPKNLPQLDGMSIDDETDINFNSPKSFKKHKNTRKLNAPKIHQVDGASADNSSDDEDKEEEEIEQIEEENEEGDIGENILNSEDDVSEEEWSNDVFDTCNIAACLYEKINRIRNNWKLVFKDGIMNLNGRDYIFHKMIGHADW